MKPVTAQQMAEIDRRAQEEYGISQTMLMENAGRAVAEIICSDIRSSEKEKIVVFCGKGNNGGDGFVASRYIVKNKPSVKLTIFVWDMENVKKGAAYDNLKIIKKRGLDIRDMKDLASKIPDESFTIGVDSMFGTGFRGELPEECAYACKYLNGCGARIYAIDIPSGLDATTGEAAKDCPNVYKTITFGMPKKGFFIKDGPAVSGEIVVKDIGFPAALLQPYM